MQVNQRPRAVTLQRFFDFVQQIVTAEQKLNRFIQFVEHFAQGVF